MGSAHPPKPSDEAGAEGGLGGPAGAGAERANATLHAYLELKRLINANQLTPGRTYLQQTLAEMLDVSRTPIREAVIRLAEERLVEIRPRYGVYVKPFSTAELAEIYDCLAALESFAAMRVTERQPSPAFLDHLTALLAAMEAATDAKDVAAWVEADKALHEDIVAETGNRQLRAAVAGHWERMSRTRLLTGPMRTIPVASNREHAAIVAAMRKGDARKVHELFLKHRERAAAETIEMLKRHGVSEL